MLTESITQVTSSITNLASTALSILGIIGRWFIFQSQGKEGWRSIVPFLNTYTYGEIADEKKKTIAHIILNVVTIILAFAIGICFGIFIVFSESSHDMPEESLIFLGIVFLFLVLVLLTVLIINLILKISIFKKVDEKLNVNGNWIIGWIFIPSLTEFILGLQLKNSSNN